MGLVMLSCCLKEQHHDTFLHSGFRCAATTCFDECVDIEIRMGPDVYHVTMDGSTDLSTQTLRQYEDIFNASSHKVYDAGSQHTTCGPTSPLHTCRDRVKAELDSM